MSQINDHLSLPVELIAFALKHKKVNPLKLYISLKVIYPDGQFILNKKSRKHICHYLKYKTPKTFNNNIKWLIKNKWITFNNDYCIIKSFKKLASKYKFTCQKTVVFTPEWDMPKFRAFLYGALIKYNMEWIWKRKRRSGANKGCSYTKRNSGSFPSFFILPNTYLAKLLDISKSSASNYKKIANEAGYINVKHDFSPITIEASCHGEYLKWLDKSKSKKVRRISDELFIQNPDKITSGMIIKRNRNLRNIITRGAGLSMA